MAFVNFVKSKTQAQSLTDSATNPGKVYFPTDTTNIVMGGKKYGSVAETAINLNVTALKQGDDLNNFTTSGLYGTGMTVVCNSLLNKPGISFGECLLSVGQCSGSTYVVQRLFTLNTGVWQEWTRMKRGGEGFSPWVQTADSNIPITSLAPKDSPVFSGKALFTDIDTVSLYSEKTETVDLQVNRTAIFRLISTEHIETKGLVASIVASSSGESVVEFKEDGSAKFESEVIYKGQFLDQRFEKKKKLKWMNVIGKSYPYGTANDNVRYFWKDGWIRVKFTREQYDEDLIDFDALAESADASKEYFTFIAEYHGSEGNYRIIETIRRDSIKEVVPPMIADVLSECPQCILTYRGDNSAPGHKHSPVIVRKDPSHPNGFPVVCSLSDKVLDTTDRHLKIKCGTQGPERVICTKPCVFERKQVKYSFIDNFFFNTSILQCKTYPCRITKIFNSFVHRRSKSYRRKGEKKIEGKSRKQVISRTDDRGKHYGKILRMGYAPFTVCAIHKGRWVSDMIYTINPVVQIREYIED